MNRYDIAIIGMGCVFPGSPTVEKYWENIRSGETFFSSMPQRIWRERNFVSKNKSRSDKSYTMVGSFVEPPENFPFLEYKLPPNAMKGSDPCQLVTLEAARQALHNAGISAHSEVLTDAITVIGASGVDQFAHSTLALKRHNYLRKLRPMLEARGVPTDRLDALVKEFEAELARRGHSWHPSIAAVGAITASLSNRVAQVFGVRGFNMTVDGACASSFVALDVACHALMAGDARIALAGGADLGTNPAIYIGFSAVEGLSTKGEANPFDHNADGLVIGEGAGVVVLKRLEDALADGDKIRAVIRGVGSSSDGAGQAIYAPSVEGRAEALRKALTAAQLTSHEVQFLEAHATSTVVGDANEYDAISSVYAPGRDSKDPLVLGSVKGQIGHLKAAAGMAGLLKIVTAMEHATLPHMPRFEKLTPGATKVSDALCIPTKLAPWTPRQDGKRMAAVTSSGFGGVNYHVLVEQGDSYSPPPPRAKVSRDMAVVGIACRTPGAQTPEEFWSNIRSGVDNFRPVDAQAMGWQEHLDAGPESERITTRVVAKIDDYKFNLLRHKIFPNAVSQIAPTQLLAVDLADKLLTDRGMELVERKPIGASLGAMHDDHFPTIFYPMCADEYADALRACASATAVDQPILEECLSQTAAAIMDMGPPSTEHTLPGWMTNVISGRVANKLNLAGPNFTVDTACSSGVGALLPAMYQLMFGDVDAMVTGGLNQQMSDAFTCGVCALGAVAEKEARPFDAEGKGFLIGEGGVFFLVRRLADAQRDGDLIHAVIHSVGGSSEADSKSMVAPSEDAVRRAIRNSLSRAPHIDPKDIAVCDTHGSANALSDIIEAKSLAAELRPSGSSEPVLITAIKSHVGHMYGGSGASSLLSTIEALRHGEAPGIRKLKNLRPEIAGLTDKAIPVAATTPLPAGSRVGGVNSLGLGGANYFAVVSVPEEARATASNQPPEASPVAPLPTPPKASAQSTEERPANVRASDSGLSDIFVCLTEAEENFRSALGRAVQQSPLPQFISEGSTPRARLTATFQNQDELKTKLGNALRMLQGGHSTKPLESQGVFTAAVSPTGKTDKLVFCFPGQGTHYIGMGRFLYDRHAGFRSVVDTVGDFAKKTFNFDLLAHIYGDPEDKDISKRLGTLVGAQCALFACEVGMARVLEGLGIEPDMMIGHSFGELSALTVAGAWELETACQVVAARIRCAEIVVKAGGPALGMMSLICSNEQRDAILGMVDSKVVLTNINAPGRFVLAGELESVKKCVNVAESFGLEARLLPIGAAFHSRFMTPAVEPYFEALRKLPCRSPRLPILSTITGEYIPTSGLSSEVLAQHLSSQLTTQLNLPREIERLHRDGGRDFLEVGPGWSLTKMIDTILEKEPHRSSPTLHPKVGDEETFRRARAFLVALGHLPSAAERKTLPGMFTSDFVEYLESQEPAVLALIGEVHRRYLFGMQSSAAAVVGLAAPAPKMPVLGSVLATAPTAPTAPAPALRPAAIAPAQSAPLADVQTWTKRVRDKLVVMTGYPEEMLEVGLDLEADLGVDSVQRAEIWISLCNEHGLSSEERPSGVRTIAQFAQLLTEMSGGSASSAAALAEAPALTRVSVAGPVLSTGTKADEATWMKRVRDKLVVMTGYPEEMLEVGLDLDADLGVDSVQRAEIWISLCNEHGLSSEERPSGVRTIAQFAQLLGQMSGGTATAAAPLAKAPALTPVSAVSPALNAATVSPAGAEVDEATWARRVRDKLVVMTGYPEEMLEVGLDLEADLGVDSVQRAEIWISLCTEHGLSSEERPSGVRTIAQFAQLLAKMSAGAGGEGPSTPKATETLVNVQKVTAAKRPWRHFASSFEPLPQSALRPANCRRVMAVVAPQDKLVSILAGKLAAQGVEMVSVQADALASRSEAALSLLEGADTLVYLSHRDFVLRDGIDLERRTVFDAEVKQLYSVMRAVLPELQKGGLRVVVPMAQDGAFGAVGGSGERPFGSFPAGLVRSLARELPETVFQLVDVGALDWADALGQQIPWNAPSLEVGFLPLGRVTPVFAELAGTEPLPSPLGKDDLVLVTGGARGIVFECVTALASATSCRLLLTGRTQLPEGSPAWLEASASELDQVIRNMEIELVRSGKMPLGQAKKVGIKAKAQWELHHNLSRLRRLGIEHQYEVCDVSSPEELRRLVEKVGAASISGVVHGAGVQRSKLLGELLDEAIDLTLSTKLTPMLTLGSLLDWSSVKALYGFGSVTGAVGNPGQTDYALANDTLACMIASIGVARPGLVAQCVDWTAWVGTGMVTDEEAKRFGEAGLVPLDVTSGVDMFLEAAIGSNATRLAVFNPGAAFASGRKISSWKISPRPKASLTRWQGEKVVAELTRSRDLFLEQHLVKLEPVAPGTFVTEMLSEAARDRGLSLRDFRFRRPMGLRGDALSVEIIEQGGELIAVPLSRPELGGKGLNNLAYATARIGDNGPEEAGKLKITKKDFEALVEAGQSAASDFYHLLDERFSSALKTGPIFRGIRATLERGDKFYGAVTLTPEASAMLETDGQMVFNPILADLAVQVGCAFSMLRQDVMAIPFEIGALEAHAPMHGRDAVVICRSLEMTREQTLLDVAVRTPEGTLVMTMEHLLLKTIA
ncbi:MAG: acyltransferase domain-containing protein [Myxococcota bacterium]|nr:acyltransferase domain-containing protein [Myxococcota bacterium]